MLLAVHGFMLSISTMTDEVSEAALDGELELLLDRYLGPVVEPNPPSKADKVGIANKVDKADRADKVGRATADGRGMS